jgi:hypothetical protein
MRIVTKKQTMVHAALLEVEVGTTGLCGGDTGHGGRTYLRLEDEGGTDITVRPISSGTGSGGVELVFGGDAELENLIAGLQFALHVLQESKENGTVAYGPTIGSKTID